VEKNFRSILNKLTPENFNVLLDQIRDLSIDNQERLERCIILLFEKAISEPLFAPCYANLCQEIATMYVPHKEKEKVTFRYILVHHCQKEFEKHRTDRINQLDKGKKLLEAAQEDKTKLASLQQELQEENNRIRHRAVGTIRFIGELYKIEVLKSHIMMECVKILWEYGDTKSLECLCKLLTTIGKSMEEKGFSDNLGEYFDKLEQVIDRKTIPVESRIR
jgi:translation initiation factor 4G